jgi:glycerol kinase
MTTSFILALDQGTTSSRSILINNEGLPVAMAQQPITQYYPSPGWVEHDPAEIWATQLQTARQVLASSGVTADQIAAIGITNQRETIVMWDRRTGKPLYPAIVWQCRRTADYCEQLVTEGQATNITARTGLQVDAYFSASKITWLLNNVAPARALALAGHLAVGTIDTWLIWQLSGGQLHVTDVSNASRTMLFNIHKLEWDAELLRLFDIPPTILPQVIPSSGIIGNTATESFGRAIPIAGVAGDQQAALFGQTCFQPGQAKNTYGTGCFVLFNTGTQARPSKNRLLTTIAWQLSNQPVIYALEGAVFIAGAAVQWLRDGLQIINNASEIMQLAASVPDSGGVYIVPAFVGLGAPYWDAYARGTILGITRGTTRAELARATLEAIGYQTRDLLDALQADAGQPLQQLVVDGGATINDLLLQLQADILGIAVVRPAIIETTVLGAAYLAGLGVGYWPNLATLTTLNQEMALKVNDPKFQNPLQGARPARFMPTNSAIEREERYRRWQKAVQRAAAWDKLD